MSCVEEINRGMSTNEEGARCKEPGGSVEDESLHYVNM